VRPEGVPREEGGVSHRADSKLGKGGGRGKLVIFSSRQSSPPGGGEKKEHHRSHDLESARIVKPAARKEILSRERKSTISNFTVLLLSQFP